MKDLKIGDIINLEDKKFKVISRLDDVLDPPEYFFQNIDTEEIHGPVFWHWLANSEGE